MNTKLWWSRGVVGMVMVALLVGCARRSENSVSPSSLPAPPASEISVFVTADLRGAFDEAIAGLGQALPDVTWKVESGPWPALRDRILQGECPDLLVSLGPEDLIPLVKQGLVADGGNLARVRLALVQARARPINLTSCPELAREQVKTVAVAGSGSALGAATQRALKEAKLLRQVQPKLRPVEPQQLVATVAAGEADVAIVPLHWLRPERGEADSLERTVDVPENLYGDFYMGVSVIASGPHLKAAQAVLPYLTGPTVKQVFVAWGGAPLEGDAPGGRGESLLVHCGAGLRRPMDEIGRKFSQKYGVEVRYNYTGSPCLLAQIMLHKKGDLYLPGEDFYMQQAVERGLVREHRVVAYFVPVIMVRKGNPHGITGLEDLLKPGLKVGLGDPQSCAVGNVCKKVLEKNGLWEPLEASGNLTFLSATAPELGNHIKFGTIDAALNWDAVASWYEDKADIIPIPARQNLNSACPLGILEMGKSSPRDLARKFLEFVAREGQTIFQKHHYTIDPAQPSYPERTTAAATTNHGNT